MPPGGEGPVRRGWWRRNRSGLLLLVPVLVVALWSPVRDTLDTYRRTGPRQPVSGAPGGWVDFAGTRMRLVSLTEDDHPGDARTGGPALPPGVRAWRAVLAFDPAASHAVDGCQLELEDTAGRRYDDNPNELSPFFLPFASCAPDDADNGEGRPAPDGAPGYRTWAYFVMPAGARPAAVRVLLATHYPRYARLLPPA